MTPAMLTADQFAALDALLSDARQQRLAAATLEIERQAAQHAKRAATRAHSRRLKADP